MITKDYVDHVILYNAGFDVMQKATVEELSPNGEYVRIGTKWWPVRMVEVLDTWPTIEERIASITIPDGKEGDDD